MNFKDEENKQIKQLKKLVHAQENELKILSEEKLRLNAYLDLIAGIHWWKDKEGIYRGCNDAMVKELGLSCKEDIIGKSDYELPWADQAEALVQNDKEVMSTGKIQKGKEEPVQLKNKELHIFMVTKAPLYNHKNEIIGTVGCSVDITSIKEMEKELLISKEKAEVANHAKSEFIANVSHDIRTPLVGIINFSDYLKNEIEFPEEKNYAEAIHQSGEQLLQLLNGVLEVINADTASDDSVHRSSFNFRQLMDDLLQLELPAIESKHLKLHYLIDENLPDYVVSDRMKIHRIFLNLVGNAIKFTKEGNIKLEVRLISKRKNTVCIECLVKDTGIGIPKELQDKVFDRFFKVSPSYKGKYTGNGIGLHIVQRYVALLGGDIQFSSEEGKGTTFSFTLTMPVGKKLKGSDDNIHTEQLIRQEKKEIKPKEEALIGEKPLMTETENKVKILLVEDNAIALMSLKLQMQAFNVDISEAMDGESAFELIKKKVFDLIITDIGLPGISGDELVRKIRAYENQAEKKPQTIYGLTGHATDGEFGEKCIDAGINAMFQKPMTRNILNKMMTSFVLLASNTKENKDKKQSNLGVDLPNTEAQLFEINHHPLFDISVGLTTLGSEDLVKMILKDFKKDTIDGDLAVIKKSHEVGDWETIEKLAHKIKGGACYGTVRLYYALLYMERYLKAKHIKCAEALYFQMIRVIEETTDYLEKNYKTK